MFAPEASYKIAKYANLAPSLFSLRVQLAKGLDVFPQLAYAENEYRAKEKLKDLTFKKEIVNTDTYVLKGDRITIYMRSELKVAEAFSDNSIEAVVTELKPNTLEQQEKMVELLKLKLRDSCCCVLFCAFQELESIRSIWSKLFTIADRPGIWTFAQRTPKSLENRRELEWSYYTFLYGFRGHAMLHRPALERVHTLDNQVPFEELINTFTNVNDIIFDPYADEGDVLRAALKTQRFAIGVQSDVLSYNKIIWSLLDKRLRCNKSIEGEDNK